MKDGIAGGMSNFQNSSVCYLYLFFPANVLCFHHCDQSLLWKEPERPRCPGHSSLGKGLGSATAELRAGLQPRALSRGTGLGAAEHGLSTPCSSSCPSLLL